MTMGRRCAFFIILLAFAVQGAGSAAAADRIALLISSDDAPYKEAVAGFHESLARQAMQPTYQLYSLGGDPSRASGAIQNIKQSAPGLVLALGSLAADAVAREINDIPIVAGLVLRTDVLRKAPNITGVGLDLPEEVQLNWIRKLVPPARTIGVIYSAAENGRKIEAAARTAKTMGLALEAQAVSGPLEVPAALERLAKRANVLWGLVDTVAMSPQMAKPILVFSLQNSIPFVGPSAMWVKAGALGSQDFDYKDIGAQCGDIAVKVLKGAAPAAIPPEAPRRVTYSLNMNTARQLKLTLPEDVVRGARQTF